jgi:hypothetical protein
MGKMARQQKYKAAEKAAVTANSNMLGSRLTKQRSSGPNPEASERVTKATAVSKKANELKASLKAPSTKAKKVK